MTSPLTELQALGQAFDADDIDTCATCGEIVCDHSDADYRGWSDPDAGLAPVGGV